MDYNFKIISRNIQAQLQTCPGSMAEPGGTNRSILTPGFDHFFYHFNQMSRAPEEKKHLVSIPPPGADDR